MPAPKITPEYIARNLRFGEDVSIIDALVKFAADHDIEVEILGEIIRKSPALTSVIEEHADRLNLLST